MLVIFMLSEEFKNIAHSFPPQPGIYKYFDKKDSLLYIGKAKNLRKRISSYFIKQNINNKTIELVNQIFRIEIVVVDSEQDAFFLENSLIKKFQPKYNINLKDDKTYPYIVIKNEPFPRIFLTRKIINDGSEYLGPFTSVFQLHELLQFIKQTIPIRNCTLNLSPKNIEKKKFKICLEYHLGNCKGPCEGLQTAEDYQKNIAQIKNILKGNLSPVIQYFKYEMNSFSKNMQFEKAEQAKKKIEFLTNYQSKSVIVNPKLSDLDIFYILKKGTTACVNYLKVQSGTIVQTKTIHSQTFLGESLEEILIFAIAQLRNNFKSVAKEIVIPFRINYPEIGIKVTVPKIGDKQKLLALSEKNATYFIGEQEKKRRLHLNTNEITPNTLLQKMKVELHLPETPTHIECFDNSNIQGAFPVAAMVCFKNAIASKKDYRKFKIKTVKGIDDFASMKETVYRRYKRVLDEKLPFPQLIIIDGGKGQLNSAKQALQELNAIGKTTLIGLAKKEEEIFFANDTQSLKLPLDSKSLQLIRKIRDEAHRFVIRFHRNKRSKDTFFNELEMIKGVGNETINLLLKQFKSVISIKKQTEENLATVVGKAKAKIIYTSFQK